VEAGVVKDQLNDADPRARLFFAPELSPSNRATIGGMIATDASGQGSVLYGKTHDHVLELKCVLLDGPSGTRCRCRGRARTVKRAGSRRHVHRCSTASRRRCDLIAERLPAAEPLRHGIRPRHLGMRRAGSTEFGAVRRRGTLAFVTGQGQPVPIPGTRLVNIRYGASTRRLRDAGALMQRAALERDDRRHRAATRARRPIWLRRRTSRRPAGAAQGVNLVEFLAENDRRSNEARARRALLGEVAGRRLGYTDARDEARPRGSGRCARNRFGLLATCRREAPVPFVEGLPVVPPENLADYIAEFRAVLDAAGLVYGMFGHVDAAACTCGPALDMKDPAQERMVREISDEVFALTAQVQGRALGRAWQGSTFGVRARVLRTPLSSAAGNQGGVRSEQSAEPRQDRCTAGTIHC
jgi:FAD/FMN-containing dehydrogenase